MVLARKCLFGGPLVCSTMVSGVSTGYQRMQGASKMSKPTFEQTEEFYEQVKSGRITRENLQVFLRDPNRGQLLTIGVAELIPKGWEIVEDIAPSKFQVKDLEFISFLEKGEEYIGGEVMRQRAVKLKANLGLADAKYLLDHQAEIPAKLRGKKYIVLPGTVLRDSCGDLGVPYLGWGGGRWVLDFCWVDDGFSGRDVLAPSK